LIREPEDDMPNEDDGTLLLTASEIQVLLGCLTYSIQRVSEAPGTPNSLRQENLQRLYSVQEKLRRMKIDKS
jgi:hypothetical protein